MNVIIMTDLEGLSGVNNISMMDGEGYKVACERLNADINAAVAGCIDGGAEKVYVIDGHGTGKNIDGSGLDSRCSLIYDWQDRIKNGEVDAMIVIGAHAKPGTINGFLDHVQSSASWFEYTINGIPYGELAQGAVFCGAYNVPVLMMSGDRAACDEAMQLIPGIVTASVKEGRGRNEADCLPNDEAEALIRKKACEGMAMLGKIQPFKFPLPLTIRLTHYRTDHCDETMKRHPEFTRLDGRTVQRVVDKIESYSDLLFW